MVAWAFPDPVPSSRRALDHLEADEAVVPHLWPLEVANGVEMAVRRERIAPSEAGAFLRALASLPIVVHPNDRVRAFDETTRIARVHRLTVYDAAYLELAIRVGVPLATLDGQLQAAARSEGVPLL